MVQKAICRSCGWEGKQGDCGFGHNDFYCPHCGKENIEMAPNPSPMST